MNNQTMIIDTKQDLLKIAEEIANEVTEPTPGIVDPIIEKPQEISPKLSTYTHEQLRDVLMMAADYLERCDIPYVLWGKTLKHAMSQEEELTGDDQIELAIKRSEVTDAHISILDHWARNVVVATDIITFSCNNIPVVIKILPTDEPLLANPDYVNYWIEMFKIPNPYKQYQRLYE